MKSVSSPRAALAAALISPPGRGAVATWRILGSPNDVSRLPFTCARRTGIANQPVGRIWFGHWNGEEAVLTRTATDQWELSVHGGHASLRRVRHDLERHGVELCDWEKLHPLASTTLESEYIVAATKSVTWTTTELLLRHPTREWIAELQQWQHLFSRTPTQPERDRFVAACREWLSWSEFGQHLVVPYRVALIGEPNVGKSSLLNRLAGFERAIVQDYPGTTRDLVAVEVSFSGYPFHITDTAGLRDTSDQLESEGISRTNEILEEVDLIVQLLDVSSPPHNREQTLTARFPHAMRIAHKSDLPLHTRRTLNDRTLPVSSLSGEGIDELVNQIVTQLIPRVPSPQTVFPVTDRQIDLLQFLQDHGTAASPDLLGRRIEELLFQDQNHNSGNC